MQAYKISKFLLNIASIVCLEKDIVEKMQSLPQHC